MKNRSDIDEAIAKVQTGDVEAFTLVVERYQQGLRSWLSRGCAAGIDSDDLAHRAFITAFKRIHDYRPGGNCFTWLCTIARNHLRDELRRQRRSRQASSSVLDRLALVEISAAEVDGQAGDERRLIALRHCLAALPTAMGDLLQRYSGEQMPLAHLATVLETSLGAVKARLQHLRRKLHDCVTTRLAGEEA